MTTVAGFWKGRPHVAQKRGKKGKSEVPRKPPEGGGRVLSSIEVGCDQGGRRGFARERRRARVADGSQTGQLNKRGERGKSVWEKKRDSSRAGKKKTKKQCKRRTVSPQAAGFKNSTKDASQSKKASCSRKEALALTKEKRHSSVLGRFVPCVGEARAGFFFLHEGEKKNSFLAWRKKKGGSVICRSR